MNWEEVGDEMYLKKKKKNGKCLHNYRKVSTFIKKKVFKYTFSYILNIKFN